MASLLSLSPVPTIIICVGGCTCASSLLASVFIASESENTAPLSEDDYTAKPHARFKRSYADSPTKTRSSLGEGCLPYSMLGEKKATSPRQENVVPTKVLLSPPRHSHMEGLACLSGRTTSAGPRMIDEMRGGAAARVRENSRLLKSCSTGQQA